jgi:ribonuclease HI
MELMAAIKAIERVKGRAEQLTIRTDSKYLRDSITDWLNDWIGRGWRRRNGEPAKNVDLWKKLHGLTEECSIEWKWVKAHSGDPWNSRADRLAKRGVPKLNAIAKLADVVHLFTSVQAPTSQGPSQWRAVLRYNNRWTGDAGGKSSASERELQLIAVFEGLKMIGGTSYQVHVYTSCSYVHKSLRTSLSYWRENGWQKRDGAVVWRKSLWQQIDAHCSKHSVRPYLCNDRLFPTQEWESVMSQRR